MVQGNTWKCQHAFAYYCEEQSSPVGKKGKVVGTRKAQTRAHMHSHSYIFIILSTNSHCQWEQNEKLDPSWVSQYLPTQDKLLIRS